MDKKSLLVKIILFFLLVPGSFIIPIMVFFGYLENNVAFKLISDIHTEFFVANGETFVLPELETDRDDVLVLAGDIGLADYPSTYEPYLIKWSEQFAEVIYIMGNHEFYKTSYNRGMHKIRERVVANDLQNVHVINREVVEYPPDDVVFVCATLWSSFNNGNPITMMNAKEGMNDYIKIRTGPSYMPYQRKFTPQDAYGLFIQDKEFIEKAVREWKDKVGHVVVVTHHSPSFQSIAPEYKTSNLNGAYSSQLDDLILELQPDCWVHGHHHHSNAYEIGETAVISNPHGYFGNYNDINADFIPGMRIEFN